MASVGFDPVAYKETTRKQWQDAAGAWHSWDPVFDRWLGPATELMLDLAGVKEGTRVLDIAAGSGGQSISAGRRRGDGARDRHLGEHPPRGRGGGTRSRRFDDRHPRARRRNARRRRGHVRRRDLAPRADVHAGQTRRIGTGAARVAERGPVRGDRVRRARPERLLLGADRDHPPAGASSRRRRLGCRDRSRRHRSATSSTRRDSATSRCTGSTRRSSSPRRPSALGSSGSRSAPSTRCWRG